VSNDVSEAGPAPAALTTGLVSFRKPDGLVLSTGNLYFTSHDANFGTVWRMDQSALPGQEILLHAELGARFGDIVFAQVGGAFFGYFFATGAGPTVTIKRIPLSGGPATVLATLTDIDIVNDRRNLVTDGVNLYWQDVSTVRKMPIGGGDIDITVLDQSQPNTPTAGVALQAVVDADERRARGAVERAEALDRLHRQAADLRHARRRVVAEHAVAQLLPAERHLLEILTIVMPVFPPS